MKANISKLLDKAVDGQRLTPEEGLRLLESSDLSALDYFHPSIVGQAKIAAITWQKAVQKGVFASASAAPAHTEGVVDETSSAISSAADHDGSVAYLREMRSGFSLRFTGTKVSVLARTTSSAGISEVRIDGELVARVDSYSPSTRHQQVIFESTRLASGTHTITVTATTDMAAASSGRNLILDALLIEQVTP